MIRKLSPEIIGQIAAGEVVERPASAVKELVENSIDAGAKNVTVELREGGIKYLRVSDNGRGIPPEQIRMAFERHATSKISEAKDLFDIQTLGFRGEALASIAAVARVTCTTRTQDAPFGTRAVVEAGEFTDIRQAASPVGTTIVAEDLFFNTPVRLKFLKKPAQEALLVSDYMLRLILSHPEVAFRFVSQGKTVYHSMGDGKPESALYSIYGREAFQQMKKVSGHMNGVLISGYVGTGELSRGNRQHQSFFVNGRYFRSALLSHALEKGCEGAVMIGRFPMCALFLEVQRQQVDVNVHPNKLEVRFQNEMAVAAAVETLVREAMQAESLSARLSQPVKTEPIAQQPSAPKSSFSIVELDAPQKESPVLEKTLVQPEKATTINVSTAPVEPVKVVQAVPALPVKSILNEAPIPVQPKANSYIPPEPKKSQVFQERPLNTSYVLQPEKVAAPVAQQVDTPVVSEISVPQMKTAAVSVEPEEPVQTVLQPVEQMEVPLRMAGIVFDTYWIFETEDRLLLVDQHAAHERILYDQMIKRFEGERISQKLLAPQLVQLTPYDMTLVSEFIPVLAEAGFEVEQFDDTSVALHAIPTFFGVNESPKELLLEALAEWQAGRGQVTRERLRRRVAQMACKRAIKGGDRLNETEIEGFMREMLRSDSMPTCPHGRPIVTEITRYALEKRFKRIQ
ncbi:MAG: DNA mismatch repair endonuclease MutL [Clostridia bacterium]|nr:DNA mismatch repair endonuclease MutL [Clostridia bacterium]